MAFSFEEEIVKLPKKRKKLANEVGCLLCPLSKHSPISLSNNSTQTNPKPHTGVYILGETPNDFTGLGGNLIQSTLTKIFYPNNFEGTVQYGSILKCNTDDITDLEIECCKSLVEKDIEKSHPLAIIGLGDKVLKWMLGLSSFEVWRGRVATVKINDWVCFFIPTYSPAYLSSLKDSFFKEDAIKFFHRDTLKAIYTGINDSPEYIDKGFTEGVTIINKTSTNPIAKIRTTLNRFKDLPEVALDLETTGLSPYKQDIKILSIAIGTTSETIAFPLEHEGFWEEQDLIEVKKILKDFILNSSTKICHNLKFDLSFLAQMFGNSIVKETLWGDTMLLAYAINEKNVKMKEGPLSLNSLCEIEFGLKLKKLTELDKTTLKDVPLDTLLTYNALDVKYTHKLYKALDKRIQNTPKLMEVYALLVKTSGTLVLTEQKGIVIDLEKVDIYKKEIQDKIKNIDAELKEDQGIKLYEKNLGTFNPSSNDQIGILLKDILKLPKLKGTETDDSYSTDKDTLELYGEMGVSCAKLLSDRRAFIKLNSTYLDPITTLLDKDGRLRTSFSLAFTATGRLCVAKGTYIQTVRDFSTDPKGILIENIKEGDIVYTYDENKNLTLKKVLWAGKTGTKKVIRLHWRGTGNKHTGFLDVTPEHEIRLIDGTYIKAKDLKRYDRVLALYACVKPQDYVYLYITGQKKCIKNARFIAKTIYKIELDKIIHVHHKNGNKLNDTIENLQVLNSKCHTSFHAKSRTVEDLKKMGNTLKEKYRTGEIKPKCGVANSNYIALSKIQCLKIIARTKGAIINAPYDFTVVKDRLQKYGLCHNSLKLRYCGKRKEYISKSKLLFLIAENNNNFIEVCKTLKCDYYKFKKLLQHYSITLKFKRKKQYTKTQETVPHNCRSNNHTILAIEEVQDPVDVYDIEVEDTHNFIANELCIHNSSSAPNLQNIPRRSANYIRNIVVPPSDDYYFLACDLGQIEARLIAIASQDKEFCKAIREGYDIHKHWAIEICKIYPKACGVADVSELKDKKLKQFRDRVKNEFVFPAFYGSSKNSIGKSLEIPEPEITKIFDMFWNMFPGVKNWQKENNNFYAKNGYTETLTGRRRHGPMSYTKIVNTPIQSLAADLVLDSMNRVSDIAYKTNNPELQPILQIHDDLSFYINKNSLDSSMEVIAKEMCRLPWSFINIPLTVEIKIGKSWGELEEVAVFSTNDFKY